MDQLKAGSYATAGATSVAFPKVVLAGHSVGSIIAQAEAYTFGGIDGLMMLSYSDTKVSLAATAALGIATQACQAGGVRQNGTTGPTGYIYFGADTPAKFIEAHFYTPNADPTVVQTVAALRNRDPCGDILSYKAAVATNLANISKIKVPVLVLIGSNDAIYPTPATTQAGLFTGTTDVTAAASYQTQMRVGALLILMAADIWLWSRRRRVGQPSQNEHCRDDSDAADRHYRIARPLNNANS